MVNLRSIGRCLQGLEGSRKVEGDGPEFAAIVAAYCLQRHGQELPQELQWHFVFMLRGQAKTAYESHTIRPWLGLCISCLPCDLAAMWGAPIPAVALCVCPLGTSKDDL